MQISPHDDVGAGGGAPPYVGISVAVTVLCMQCDVCSIAIIIRQFRSLLVRLRPSTPVMIHSLNIKTAFVIRPTEILTLINSRLFIICIC